MKSTKDNEQDGLIRRDIAELKEQVKKIADGQDRLYEAVMGGYDNPGGMSVRVSSLEEKVYEIERGLGQHKQAGEKKTNSISSRVEDLERWRRETRVRVVALIAGISLGSAGVGATVAKIASVLLAGPTP